MNRQLIIEVLAAVIISILVYQNITVINTQQSILTKYEDIEQKLASIESSQSGISNLLKSANSARPTRAQRPPAPDLSKVYKIDIEGSPINGNKNAPITIVEYSEVQCPYSQRFHPIIKEVTDAYPDKVRHVFKHFPLSFHKQARPAAKAILAAGEQGKYWEMLEILFKNGRDLSDDKYEDFAGQLGLDVDKFTKDLTEKDAQWEAFIDNDMKQGSSINVRGTPTFFLNGKITRARSLENFKQEIDAILQENNKK